MSTLSIYITHLADSALILGHRNSEWTGHGPVLEQDIAISNIALDLIGQSRNLYQLAAKKINALSTEKAAITEDDLAYLRDVSEYRNLVLTEQPNGDWAKTILRQFYFSQFQYLQYQGLIKSCDPELAAIAEKSILETRYHLTWSSEWVLRLGDGTTESHSRMLHAMETLSSLIPELFSVAGFEKTVAERGFGINPSLIRTDWLRRVNKVLEAATLPVLAEVEKSTLVFSGKNGLHSEHLGHILAEMQYLQRTYPGCEW